MYLESIDPAFLQPLVSDSVIASCGVEKLGVRGEQVTGLDALEEMTAVKSTLGMTKPSRGSSARPNRPRSDLGSATQCHDGVKRGSPWRVLGMRACHIDSLTHDYQISVLAPGVSSRDTVIETVTLHLDMRDEAETNAAIAPRGLARPSRGNRCFGARG